MSSIEGRETTPPQTPQEEQTERETKTEEISKSNQKADERRKALEVIRPVFSRG